MFACFLQQGSDALGVGASVQVQPAQAPEEVPAAQVLDHLRERLRVRYLHAGALDAGVLRVRDGRRGRGIGHHPRRRAIDVRARPPVQPGERLDPET
jgi:hypothetical protein